MNTEDIMCIGDHSVISVTYFKMVSQDVRGGFWWYGCWSLNFPQISHKHRHKVALVKWFLIWKVYEAGIYQLIFLCGKMHLLTFINVYGNQTVDMRRVRRRVMRFSRNNSNVCDKPMFLHMCHPTKWRELR